MRTQGTTRGDGSPAGVHISAANRRHPVAQASAHGLHIRRGYGSLLTPYAITQYTLFALQLDEINQLFLPNMKNKLLWFYQEVDEPEPPPVVDANKPGPSRTGMASSSSKTPQGKGLLILIPSWFTLFFLILRWCLTKWFAAAEAQEIVPHRRLDLCLHWRLYLHLSREYIQAAARGGIPEGSVSFAHFVYLS